MKPKSKAKKAAVSGKAAGAAHPRAPRSPKRRPVRAAARRPRTDATDEAQAQKVLDLLEAQNMELREAQGDMEGALQRYASLFDYAPVGYTTLDSRGRIWQINFAGAALLGRTRETLTGLSFAMFVASRKDRALLSQHLRLSRASADPAEAITTELYLGCRKPRLDRLVHLMTRPADVLAKGHLLVAITDISGLRVVQESLRVSEERLSAILGAASDAIITFDEEERIVFLNVAAEHMFACPVSEVIGQPLSRLIPKRFRVAHMHHLHSCTEVGGSRQKTGSLGVLHGLRADGVKFPAEASTSETVIGGARLVTLILRDITERQRMEKEMTEISERERRRLGQDLHDGICQHLSGVAMMADTLSDACRRKSLAEEAGKIKALAELVRMAANDARNVARGLHPVDVDANGLFSALHELVAGHRAPGQVQCHFRCTRPVPVHDNDVALHLYRIAQEALVNASKHAHARSIIIDLGIQKHSIVLTIVDDGIGLRPGHERTPGLGLSMMRHRAGVIGATLAFDASGAGGTVVRCVLPLPDGRLDLQSSKPDSHDADRNTQFTE